MTDKNTAKVSLSIGVAGLALMFAPISSQGKLLVATTSAALCTYQACAFKASKQKTTENLEEKELLLNAKAKELEASLISLEIMEAELESKKRIAEVEAIEKRKALDAELARSQESFLAEMSFLEGKRKRELESDLIANKTAILAAMQSEIAKLEQEKQSVLSATLAEIQQLEGEKIDKENAISLWEKQQRDAINAEIARTRSQWDKEVKEAEKQMAEEYQQLQDEMIQELQALKDELRKESEAKYQEWLIPHCQEMDNKLKEIDALKATIATLQEQIAEDRDIVLCKESGTVHGDRSNAVLLWLKQMGQYCDYQSSTVLPTGTFVLNFLPWEVGSKSEKAIKGLLLSAQVKFGLTEPPSFEPNGEARAWTLTFYPARNRAIALGDFYVQQIPEVRLGETFQDIEPAIRDGVARGLNYQQQVSEMMSFTPPVPLSKPRSYQISELEMTCFKWFYSWRSLATDGQEQNITTRAGLLYHIYGVREGRTSSVHDPLLCESLGQRVSRVLNILRLEEVVLKQQGESENA
jgi:hypothetical protein